jgi:hypothetical protein
LKEPKQCYTITNSTKQNSQLWKTITAAKTAKQAATKQQQSKTTY